MPGVSRAEGPLLPHAGTNTLDLAVEPMSPVPSGELFLGPLLPFSLSPEFSQDNPSVLEFCRENCQSH